MKKKKIVFLTGTRADFGKLKSLIDAVEGLPFFEIHIFATGMHMLEKYGATVHEIFKEGYEHVYMYNNLAFTTSMDVCLANTIHGFSNYVKELKPDLIIVHGDRAEALAGAIVGSFNNILVGHVEGGELSGTIDGLIRHSITKLSHIHFVTNGEAEKRLLQLGEALESIFKIGSPEVDLMLSDKLPLLSEVKKHYEIDFDNYAICIYHPVTTEIEALEGNVGELVDAVIESKLNYIVVAPNSDLGSDRIFKAYERFKQKSNIRMIPSIRFEYFLRLLKSAKFIIGNSSSGVREASVYGIPAINVGSRQSKRSRVKSKFDVVENKAEILQLIKEINGNNLVIEPFSHFGDGKSSERFIEVLQNKEMWKLPLQKTFNDYNREETVIPF